MRDIRFRAWDNEGKWFLPNIQNHIGNSETAFGYMLRNDRYVIEQFTGFYDKNGHTIYEGDILRKHGKVVFSDGAFSAVHSLGDGYKSWQRLSCCFPKEIIGNIHEKPEVLNG